MHNCLRVILFGKENPSEYLLHLKNIKKKIKINKTVNITYNFSNIPELILEDLSARLL